MMKTTMIAMIKNVRSYIIKKFTILIYFYLFLRAATSQRIYDENKHPLKKCLAPQVTSSQKSFCLQDIADFIQKVTSLIVVSYNLNEFEQNIKCAVYYYQQTEDKIKQAIINIKKSYHQRFPELDSIITNPIDYIMVVKVLGNDFKISKCEALQQNFNPALTMIISVTAATSQGKPLSDKEISCLQESFDEVETLEPFKIKLFEIIEKSTSLHLPNVTAIIGASLAAQIISCVGRLSELKNMNLSDLFKLDLDSSGLSSGSMLQKEGLIYHSELVQQAPLNLRSKIAKQVAEKTLLAACTDNGRESITGEVGKNFRGDIETKIIKISSPSILKFKKPSSQIYDNQMKATTAKKIHEMKTRLNVGEMRQQQSRMSFADIEDEKLSHETRTRECNQIDEGTRSRIKKLLMKNLEKKNSDKVSTTPITKRVRDESCTIFTPLQGLEIINPSAVEKMLGDANRKYFSNTSGFMSFKNKMV